MKAVATQAANVLHMRHQIMLSERQSTAAATPEACLLTSAGADGLWPFIPCSSLAVPARLRQPWRGGLPTCPQTGDLWLQSAPGLPVQADFVQCAASASRVT